MTALRGSLVPLIFGLFLAFAFGEFYFDQGGYAAFVLLGGIVANSPLFVRRVPRFSLIGKELLGYFIFFSIE